MTNGTTKSDPRDTIWERAFDTYYECFFYELVADRVVNRWQITDDVTKVFVALTASGSAISGWVLWQDPELKYVWAIFAGVGAVLSIIHASLGVPSRLKDWQDNSRSFTSLRVGLETFRHIMEFDPKFDIDEATTKYSNFRQQFGKLLQQQKNDILHTDALRLQAEKDLDEKIGDEIESSE